MSSIKYVLDTNIVSALMKGEAKVLARLLSLPQSEVALPEPAAAEIAYGLARMSTSRKRSQLQQRFRLVREELQVAPWTPEVSAAFGRIKANLEKLGTQLEDFDVAIAAHAVAHTATLVTANAKHMRRIRDLQIEDWTTLT